MYSFDKRTVCYGIDDPFSSMIYLFNMVIFHNCMSVYRLLNEML